MIQTDDNTNSMTARATFQIEFDSNDPDSITTAVLEAVATCTRQDMLDLDPLDEVIDADALNDLLRPRADGTPRTNVSVEFSYQGYLVSVEGSGLVRLRLA